MKTHAIIFGIDSFKLNLNEITFFKKYKPWGIILFSRNIKNLEQVKNLTTSIKDLFKDKNFPILIDQEGGMVNRFKNIINLENYNAKYFGDIYNNDPKFYSKFDKFLKINISILKYCGININTVPVLDLFNADKKNVIGNRSFSTNYKIVVKLSKYLIKSYKKSGLETVIKHIPGHGCTSIDSHFALPQVNLSLDYLKNNDFRTFKKVNSYLAMSAHILYKNIDPTRCATQSKKIINDIIRKYLSFRGILMSDDICMKALSGSILKNAKLTLDAGCNVLLHCNGNLDQMKKLSLIVPEIDNFTNKLTKKIKANFYKFN
ncbi:glycoside hydrolase family 3 N-terminal domain-containing protein [Candidatus Fonsibacter ubiquis]|uniref:glycoside hydrolase family 3 N-terminal domain-containing protein n=1 Tax=Candidatus Fonsibacter ubiquis TaxID=1925548 RepID=UPI000C07C734|nr:glycoside hydrolase family 3 N-terminal domain-containing protein [Candidatus Fonsibacter ubiquis]